jgi:flagellar motor switch protein FliG
LNFDITSWKDYTNIILRNKNKFVNALGLQVAADVLDLILKSTSSNRIERELGSAAFTELEGFINENLPRTVGISKKLINEIARIRKTFVEVSPIRRGTL